eukprot:TRINITY_DN9225_c0_g1_i1.p1 TRINITY_DN9225_c0_g1~~TRINITY_DN9225_c0_g1_i1.p1  ORF type:complete len:567 (-),score=107.11 TRINITY_DN9225_c0_g1_i1:167-1867(-)
MAFFIKRKSDSLEAFNSSVGMDFMDESPENDQDPESAQIPSSQRSSVSLSATAPSNILSLSSTPPSSNMSQANLSRTTYSNSFKLTQTKTGADSLTETRMKSESRQQQGLPPSIEEILRGIQDARDSERTPPQLPSLPPIPESLSKKFPNKESISTTDSETNYYIFDDKRVDKQGWLTKEGRIVKNWKKRWFVLQGTQLKYFEDDTEREMKGFIDMTTSIVRPNQKEGRQCLEILVEGRKLIFHADSNQEHHEWMLALSNKISCLSYIKKSRMIKSKPNDIIVSFLQCNTDYLSIHNQEISLEGYNSLSQSLRYYKDLKHIALPGCEVDELALQLLCDGIRGNSKVEWLDLSRNKLGLAGARFLAHALSANAVITYLNLANNSIGDEGLSMILTATSCSQNLKRLVLHSNAITSEGAQHIAQHLKSGNCCLLSLDLSHNDIRDAGTEALSDALLMTSSVKTVHLEANHIGDVGASALAKFLMADKSVICLDLSANLVSPSAAQSLVDALKHNTTLKCLDLGGNMLGDQAASGSMGTATGFVAAAFEMSLRPKDTRSVQLRSASISV